LANHKQELSMAVIEILYRLSDFREDFFRNWPNRNKNYLWRPYLLIDWNKISNLYRGSSIHICYLPSFSSFGQTVSEKKIKMWKVNRRWTPSDDKSSHCLWHGEL